MHEGVLSVVNINDGMEKGGGARPRMFNPPVDGPLMTLNWRIVSIVHMKAHFM